MAAAAAAAAAAEHERQSSSEAADLKAEVQSAALDAVLSRLAPEFRSEMAAEDGDMDAAPRPRAPSLTPKPRKISVSKRRSSLRSSEPVHEVEPPREPADALLPTATTTAPVPTIVTSRQEVKDWECEFDCGFKCSLLEQCREHELVCKLRGGEANSTSANDSAAEAKKEREEEKTQVEQPRSRAPSSEPAIRPAGVIRIISLTRQKSSPVLAHETRIGSVAATAKDHPDSGSDAVSGQVGAPASSGTGLGVVGALTEADEEDGGPVQESDKDLIAVARTGHVKQLKRGLNAGCDVNVTDAAGMSPLTHACLKGSWPMVKLLVERGADVNARSKDGRSPLIAVALALQQLADDGKSLSALRTMLPDDWNEVVEPYQLCVGALLAADADTALATDDGRTAASIASAAGWAEVLPSLFKT